MKERVESKSAPKLDACSRRRRYYNYINNKSREISWWWRNIQQCSFGGIKENIIRNKPFFNH